MSPSRPAELRPRGYILLEALVASAILAALLGTAFNTLTQARSTSAASKNAMRAARYAQDQMEIMRNVTTANLAGGSTSYAAGYTCTTVVAPTADSITLGSLAVSYGYTKVTVTCTYPAATGNASVTLSVLRS